MSLVPAGLGEHGVKKPLRDDEYTALVETIIERDYFPKDDSGVIDLTSDLSEFHSKYVSQDTARFNRLNQLDLDRRKDDWDRFAIAPESARETLNFSSTKLPKQVLRNRGIVVPANTRLSRIDVVDEAQTEAVRRARIVIDEDRRRMDLMGESGKFTLPDEDARENIAHKMEEGMRERDILKSGLRKFK